MIKIRFYNPKVYKTFIYSYNNYIKSETNSHQINNGSYIVFE